MISSLEQVLEQDLFSVLGLEHLPQDKKDELFAKAYDTIMHRVLLRVADQLEEPQLDELKALIEGGDQAAVNAFMEHNQIDIDQIAMSESVAYKTEMASLAETLKAADHAN